MMAKVWLLVHGKYSDFRVVGVFSTEENAAKGLACLDGPDGEWDFWDDPRVVEYELDPVIAELNAGLSQWRIVLNDDGSYSATWYRDFDNIPTSRANGRGIYFVWARDEDHAVKIAAERHAKRQGAQGAQGAPKSPAPSRRPV